MRSIHKSWQDKRSGWTRRVRWYEGHLGDDVTIRLQFEDDDGRCNRFYADKDSAQTDYDRFRFDGVSVTNLLAERNVA